MRGAVRDGYDAWLSGEILLFGLLGAALALFIESPALRHAWETPSLALVLDTTIALAGGIVAVLAGIRFTVEGRRFDLLLSAGFFVAAASALVFEIAPVLDDPVPSRVESWAAIFGALAASGLIAAAPFVRGSSRSRQRALGNAVAALLLLLAGLWVMLGTLGLNLPALATGPTNPDPPALLTLALSLQAVLSLVALLGFGLRYRNRGDDLSRWLASAATLSLFSALYRVFAPLTPATSVSVGDFLRVIAFGVLLVGVWQAISAAEFGRAVAEERARVAREIHDGLAQYLFAISTQVNMLETGAPLDQVLPRLKRASIAAQQEARFAVLALSSAGGSARFDSALRRYVEVLTADGELDVEVDVDRAVRLAPDEQIEVFRIVQEGLGNARRHAGAKHVEVEIGQRNGRRVVLVRDDGVGFVEEETASGQGLENMRLRADAIQGELSLDSQPGRGTAIEVVLRAS